MSQAVPEDACVQNRPFDGRHVFVAGGSSGINLAIAEAFAVAGADVSILSRDQQKIDAALGRLRKLGSVGDGFAADVRDYEAVSAALARSHGSLGPIDVLVSGAAGNFPAAVKEMSARAFRAVVDIDLLGTFHVLRAGYELLRKPGAVVINISAPQAFVPAPLQAHVCAAKAGVDMLTRVLALEWGGEGIRVNSIAPGPVENTEGMARLAPDEQVRAAVRNSVPLQRLGDKDDIARAACWLASPDAGFVSGTVLVVDGGWSLAGYGSVMSNLAARFPGKAKR